MKAKAKEPVRLRQRMMPSGRVSLYLDIYLHGQRKYEYLNLYIEPGHSRADKVRNRETLRLAEAIRAKRVVELRNWQYGFSKQIAGDVYFFDYYRALMERHTKAEAPINHSLWWGAYIHLQLYESRKTITFRDITFNWVQGFRDYLETMARSAKNHAPLSPNTQANYFIRLKGCLAQALKEGIINADPSLGIEKIKEKETERMYLTPEEVKAMVGTPCTHSIIKNAFLFSCLTGLRVGDIRRLTWGDVFQQNNFTRIIFRQQKTKKNMYLDINEQAVALMGERGNDADRVFDGLHSEKTINKVLKQWTEAAGIAKHITFHSARHTFAVLMIDIGVDIFTVSKLLGHNDVTTTQIYAKILDRSKQEAVKKIPNFLDET